jgi:two-component system response regulator
MVSGFITLDRRIGRLITIRSRGALTLREFAGVMADVRAAGGEQSLGLLLVGDVRQTRVAGDEIAPLLIEACRKTGFGIERVGLLVDATLPHDASAASSRMDLVGPPRRMLTSSADLLAYMREASSDEEMQEISDFIYEWTNRESPERRGASGPFHRTPRPTIVEVEIPPTARPEMSESILFVEDNADDVALTLGAFRKSKLANEVVVAVDGVEALDWLFGTGARAGHPPLGPRVVLLDLQLPKVDGLEVLRRIRANAGTRLQPVVILTSSNEQRDLIEGYRLGINAYIRKPVVFDEFIDAVGQLNLYWLLTAPPDRPRSGGTDLGTLSAA